jgi:hypothetical protein
MGVSGQRHAPAALYPPGKDPRYQSDRRLGGPQCRSGRRGCPRWGSNPDRPARSQTLYCLSYRGSQILTIMGNLKLEIICVLSHVVNFPYYSRSNVLAKKLRIAQAVTLFAYGRTDNHEINKHSLKLFSDRT